MNIAEHQESIYAYIGQRIRERRKLLKLSQSELAELMGFSYQQMQKYETGVSHVSAGKLLLFARILNVPPNYFYEGLNLEESIGGSLDSNVIHKPRAKSFRILLIEDNPADVILFKKAMNECDGSVDVHSFHEADAAMDFLQNHEVKFNQKLPDLIMLDLSLPKMNGLALLKLIKKKFAVTGNPRCCAHQQHQHGGYDGSLSARRGRIHPEVRRTQRIHGLHVRGREVLV